MTDRQCNFQTKDSFDQFIKALYKYPINQRVDIHNEKGVYTTHSTRLLKNIDYSSAEELACEQIKDEGRSRVDGGASRLLLQSLGESGEHAAGRRGLVGGCGSVGNFTEIGGFV